MVTGQETIIDLGDVLLRHESELIEQAVPLAGRARLPLDNGDEPDHAGTAVYSYRLPGTTLLTSTVTDREGNFRLNASPSERYELQVQRPGYRAEVVGPLAWDGDVGAFHLEGSGASVDARLERQPLNGSVVAHVDVWPGWLPAGQRAFTVTLSGPNGAESRPVGVGPDGCGPDVPLCGAVAWSNALEAGRYTLQITRGGFAASQTTVTLGASAAAAEVTLGTRLENLSAANLNLRGVSIPDADLRQIPALANASLSGARLVGAHGGAPDLSCLDLSGADLSLTDLRDATLSGVALPDARLFNANLDGAGLQPRPCSRCPDGDADCLSSNRVVHDGLTDLRGASFTAASLHGAMVQPDVVVRQDSPCELQGPVNFTGARFNFADLTDAALAGASLSGVDLSNTALVGTQLAGACLERASLVLASLDSTRLDGADLSGAQLVGAVLLDTTLDDATLRRARLDAAVVVGGSLRGVDARDASLVGALFTGGVVFADASPPATCTLPPDCSAAERATCLNDLDGDERPTDRPQHPELARACRLTSFQRANLFNATFSDAVLAGVSFREASLGESSLSRVTMVQASAPNEQPCQSRATTVIADFTRTDMTGARLAEAQLCFTELRGAILDSADLNAADLSDALLSDCDWDACVDTFQPDPGLTPIACTADRWCRADPNARCYGTSLCAADEERLRATCRAGCNWPSMRLTRLDGAHLQNAHLDAADLSFASAIGADWTFSSLHGVVLDDAILTLARLGLTSLRHTRLHRTNLDRADLIGARIEQTRFADTASCYTSSRAASMVGASLRGATLHGVDLCEVDLQSANLLLTSFNDVNLEGAVLVDARGDGVRMQHVLLRGATLQTSRFGVATVPGLPRDAPLFEDVDFGLRITDRAALSNPDCVDATGLPVPLAEMPLGCKFLLQPASFKAAVIEDAGFYDTTLAWADLSDLTLRRTELYQVDLSRTLLQAADLTDLYIRRSSFADATVQDAVLRSTGRPGPWPGFPTGTFGTIDWTGATLRDVDLTRTTHSIVDFGDAHLTRVDFTDATFEGATFEAATCDACDFTRAELVGVVLWGTDVPASDFTNAAFIEASLDGLTWDATTLWSGATFDADTTCPNGQWATDNPGCGF